MDLYVYADKRGERTLIAHGGHLPAAAPKPLRLAVENYNGKDPAEFLAKFDALASGLAREAQPYLPALWELRLACLHAQKMRSDWAKRQPSLERRTEDSDGATTVADLYENFEIVVVDAS